MAEAKLPSRFEEQAEGDGLRSIEPQCLNCMWLHKDDTSRCDAFPDGIPLAIRLNEIDHRRLVPGDHGLRWFPRNPNKPHPIPESERE